MVLAMLVCHLMLLARLVEGFAPPPPPAPTPRPCSEGDPYNKMLVFQHSLCGHAYDGFPKNGKDNTLLRVVGDGRDCECAVAALNSVTGMAQNTDGWALSCVQ